MFIARPELCKWLLLTTVLWWGSLGWESTDFISKDGLIMSDVSLVHEPEFHNLSNNSPAPWKETRGGLSSHGSLSGRPGEAVSEGEPLLFPFVNGIADPGEIQKVSIDGQDGFSMEEPGTGLRIIWYKGGPLHSVTEPLDQEDVPPMVRDVFDTYFKDGGYAVDGVWLGVYQIEGTGPGGEEREWLYDAKGNLLFQADDSDDDEETEFSLDQLPNTIREALARYDTEPIRPIEIEFEREWEIDSWSIKWHSRNGVNEIALTEERFPISWERPNDSAIPGHIRNIAEERKIEWLLIRIYRAEPVAHGAPLSAMVTGRIIDVLPTRIEPAE